MTIDVVRPYFDVASGSMMVRGLIKGESAPSAGIAELASRPPYSVLGEWTTIDNTGNHSAEILKVVNLGLWIKATGSRITKSGWTEESDWDYVIYDPDKILIDTIHDDVGWTIGGSLPPDATGLISDFISLKKGKLNFIVVTKEDYWKKYIIATNLIKVMDCKTKGERIAVFDSVFGLDKNLKAVEF